MFFKKKPKKDEASVDGAETEAAAAAPDGEDGADGAPAKKKGLPLKLVIMAALGAVLILGGGGAGVWFFVLKPKPGGDHGAAEGHAPKKKKDSGGHGKAAKPGEPDESGGIVREGPDGVTFYTMPDLVVNIQSADGRPTFLKLKLTFEMKDHETAEALSSGAPRLHDMFQTFLRELRPEDLNGSQGSYQLRMEIQRRVNLLLAPHKVDAVLIEEMLIQ